MEYFPLTKAQKRIFDLERFAQGAAGIACSLLFSGPLDEAAMQRALNLIIETNDALRLRITPQAEQCFAPYQTARFPVMEFDDVQRLHSWAQQQAQIPMDMYGTLYAFTIVRAGDCRGLFLRFHHIITDAWSAARFASLVNRYYDDPKPLESPSYREYMQKQTDYLKSTRFERDRDFWLSRFRDRPEPCFLATQPPGQAAAARWSIFLPPEQVQPLRAFAAERQLSLFNLLVTAMAVYLCRLRGQTQLCLGTTTLGRADSQLKRTLGMFAGTLALPLEVDLEAGFAQHAQAGKELFFSAVRHEGFGYPDLLEAMQTQGGSEGRLYDVLINYQNAAVADMGDAFLGTEWYFCGAQPETLQLQANDRDNTGGLFLAYDYQLSAFHQEDIIRLHERLMTLLQDAAAYPEKPVAQLELLCDADREAWAAFNRSEHPIQPQPMHRFLAQQAAAHPQYEALLFGEQRLTYKQLDDWANRIAGYLRMRGVLPGGVVALRMERCLELMPLIFGIMKAGCAYLPILPAWPDARAAFALKDAGAVLLVAQPGCECVQDACDAITTLMLHDLPQQSAQDYGSTASLAYIMYTSGSTGQPKGVRVGQAGLCNRLLWMESAYPLASAAPGAARGEMLIQKTSYAFDVSAWELFWPFMQGCALLLPEPGAEKDPRRLAQLIDQHAIRTIHFVPSMLALFLDHLEKSGQQLPSLERVIVSGEALTPALNARFYALFKNSDARLYNLYGPTECTVDVLYYDCQPGDDEIPIGRPVWNTGAYVLDASGSLLPPGASGELCITGVQLADGYADPALNENRFVQHPVLGRIYRTGDLCSLRGDGQMLYHGRGDGQIKIRGQRVELAEIERQLEQAPGVTRGAVHYDGTSLFAFVCAQELFDETRVLRFLRGRLPEYMVPGRVLCLPEFPLNANGKLDRKHLAQLAEKPQGQRDAAAVEPPVNEQERQLIAAVRTQLGGNEVSMSDIPSRCGLSSLDIVSVTLELEGQGLCLQVGDFYTAPDFRTLAALAQQGSERPALVELQSGSGQEVACVGVPYGGGGFAVWADAARMLPLPFYALRSAHEDPDSLAQALLRLPFRRFVLAGSCVGSALAAALAQRLEAEDRLAGLCIAASVPPAFAPLYGRWYQPWRMQSAAAINRAMQRASTREVLLGAREIAQLREDALWFLRFLVKKPRLLLRAPIQLIYGKDDPMLQRANVQRRWERFFGRPVETIVVPGAKHDIVHTHPQEIAAQLQDLFNRKEG